MLRLLLALPCLLLAGCACPPLIESWATPQDALATWQSHLCRDDAPAEYGCLAASFKRAMGGFENYHAARAALLDEQPLTAWLLQRADLADYVTETSYTADGHGAALRLQARGQSILVRFEREAWVTVDFTDGSTQAARQSLPMEELLGIQAGRQWVLIEKPPLTREQFTAVRSVRVDGRWKIADLAGLADVGAGHARGTP